MPRYSDRPLPPYRFIPKLAPHPTADPAGHSFGRKEDEGQGGEAAFRFGADLYNCGCWWEAHEAWEGAWLGLERGGARRALVQALIQVANAHLKLQLGRGKAVLRLRGKYSALFVRAGDDSALYGFDTGPWRRQVDAYLDARLAIEPLAHDRASYPPIVLDRG
ncbi:MAG TPA: DUF309 domain-containing protein [Hyphomicrobiales bacterium]|nr:DUF309 domain-containing protein [Rhodobiaceae bacterium]HXK53240.1 DUF309 domain-containing protein [Hyphomicrobiales bacterium]